MPFVPETTTDDHLYYIIRIPQYYYSKFFKLFSNVHVLSSIYYFIVLIYNLLQNFKNVREEDVFFGAIILNVLVSKITLDSLQYKLMEFNADTRQKCWSNKHLQTDNKREKRFFSSLLLLLVVTAVVTLVLVVTIPMTPLICLYNRNSSLWSKTIYEIGNFLYFLNSFYITISIECYIVYTALHYRFQMKILTKYIKREMGNYKRMQLLHKLYSELYQEEVRQILLRSIKQYQIIKICTKNITSVLSVTILLYFVFGATAISVGMYSVAFNRTKDSAIIVAIVVHAVLAALLYSELGHLLIKTSNEFYTALTELEWYTFKKYNCKLYYMFLCYSQRYSAVTVLTTTTADRALLMQYLRTIYSAFAVLKSIKA